MKRAVDGDLDSTDLQPIPVLAPLLEREIREDLVHVSDEREHHDIDTVGACISRALDYLELMQVGGTFLGRCDAGGGVHPVRCPGACDLLVRAERRCLLEDREKAVSMISP